MVDGNHMLAGQNLKFNVEVVAIREATEELAHRHVTARTIITTITTTTVAAVVMATITVMNTVAKVAVAVKATAVVVATNTEKVTKSGEPPLFLHLNNVAVAFPQPATRCRTAGWLLTSRSATQVIAQFRHLHSWRSP